MNEKTTKQSYKFLCRDLCLNPQNVVFNWPIRKDLPGTKKIQLPMIVVTPPDQTTTKSVFNRKKRSSRTFHGVPVPPKFVLDLDPDFWSPQPETPRARKQRVLFKCRNSECEEQFTSVWQRGMHEGHCLTFDEVFILNL